MKLSGTLPPWLMVVVRLTAVLSARRPVQVAPPSELTVRNPYDDPSGPGVAAGGSIHRL